MEKVFVQSGGYGLVKFNYLLLGNLINLQLIEILRGF